MKLNKKIQIYLLGILTLSILLSSLFFLYNNILFPKTSNLLKNKLFSEFSSSWSNNEVVILIRHTERCDRSTNTCLDGENGITIKGKHIAQKIGEYLSSIQKRQEITHYNSPAKRAHQTANFIFNGHTDDQNWLRKDCENSLYKNILSHKLTSENLVLVTHSSCMKDFSDAEGKRMLKIKFGDSNTYGIAVFLKVNSDTNDIQVLGTLLAKQWPELIKKLANQ